MIKLRSIFDAYLYAVVFYYIGLASFISRHFKYTEIDFETAAEGNLFQQIVGIAIVSLGISLFFLSRKFTARSFLSMGWPIWVVILYFIFSAYWSYNISVSLRRSTALLIMAFNAALLAYYYSTRKLLNAIVNASVLVALIGLLYAILMGEEFSLGLNNKEQALKGIFTEKSAAAKFYAFTFLLIIFLRRHRSRQDLLALLLVSFSLLMTQSATGVLIALIGAVVFYVFRFSKGTTRAKTLHFTVFSICGLSFVIYALNYFYLPILNLLGRDPTLTDRLIIWELISPYITAELLVGYGYGAFWTTEALSFVTRWAFIGHAHNGYLEVLLNGGVVGLALVVLLFMHQLISLLKYQVNRRSGDLSAFYLAVFLVHLLANFVGFVLFNHLSYDTFLYFILYFAFYRYRVQHE